MNSFGPSLNLLLRSSHGRFSNPSLKNCQSRLCLRIIRNRLFTYFFRIKLLIVAVLIKMPIATYLGFLGRCPLLSREYAVLRNSIITLAPRGDHSFLEILCEFSDANLILERAIHFYPDAASYIRNALREEIGVEYRKTTTGDTWHFSWNCSRWPVDDFVSTQDAPDKSMICNECIVKKQLSKF